MRNYCDDLEPLIEAIADGSIDLGADDRSHLSSCAICAARLEQAREVERFLAARVLPEPPASFTTTVMTRVVEAKWQTERVVDIGFNLAIAAGVLVILVGGAGFLVSWGLLTITVDLTPLLNAATAEIGGSVINQLQTVAIAAVLLTMALVLWWWAEAAAD